MGKNGRPSVNEIHIKLKYMCLYTRLLDNMRYKPTKKNGGVIPPFFDERVLTVPVSCGKCVECKKKKAREWQVRLSEEIRHDNKCQYVTMTWSPEGLSKCIEEVTRIKKISGYELDNEIATHAMRKFLERVRKKIGVSYKHWAITEIGGNYYEGLHLHALIWGDIEIIKEKWQYGTVWKGDYVNEKTINYITKYVHKTDLKHKHYNSKILCSKGIGKTYIKRGVNQNKYIPGNTREEYRTRQGIKLAMPTYYRNKIYTDEEKEKLWIEKLDKNEMYIMGVQCTREDYIDGIKEARKLNKELGYSGLEKDWEEKEYEEKLRAQKQKTKCQKRNTSGGPTGGCSAGPSPGRR